MTDTDKIKTLERKNEQLKKRINQLGSGSRKSLCNVTAENKKLFSVALRRYTPKSEHGSALHFNTTSQFVKWCIKQVTGKSFKEFCEMGR